MTLVAGTRLGPYEVLSRLGAGGMGEVWRARDPRLGREVAVKVLPANLASDPSRLKRFEKEARSASALNHPNIVTIYEIGSEDSLSYIAMELVEGKTVRELLYSGPLPVRRVLHLAAQIADGLARAHDAGIVHRDLKPENVMVTKDGRVKILDFGLAKLTDSRAGVGDANDLPTDTGTAAGVVVGTVGYMSPEQACGQPLDFRSDQFSFGSILYELLTGQRAFQKKTSPETLTAILREEPVSVETFPQKIPAPLRWILERCLAKEAVGRYAATQDLSREIATVRDHLSEASEEGPGMARTTRRPSRSLILGGVLALIVALAGGYFAAMSSRPPDLASARFQQLTSRRGQIWSARFAPDGRTIVYSAAWEGRPLEVFMTQPGGVEARSLNLPPADLLSISQTGEMALLLDKGRRFRPSTLARALLAGGEPREVLEDVRWADWSSDGRNLAVVRRVGGKYRLEFPPGNLLFEAANRIVGPRVSPRGDLVAVRDRDTLAVVDLQKRKRDIKRIGNFYFDWSPSGEEIWYAEHSNTTEIFGLTLSGKERLIVTLPGASVVQDVAPDGRMLIERTYSRREMVGRFPGDTTERNLSWLDSPAPGDLSGDGRTLLFTELGYGGTGTDAVYLRKTDGSNAVRLGEGQGFALSPDGLWAVSRLPTKPRSLVLLPTGAGLSRPVPNFGISVGDRVSFHPDGRQILFQGDEPGHGVRCYLQSLDGGKPRPVTPEDTSSCLISPDGKYLLASGTGNRLRIYDTATGGSHVVPGTEEGDEPVEWNENGRWIYIRGSGEMKAPIYRLEVSSGRRELWREIAPPDRASVIEVRTPLLTPDGRYYVYGYHFYLSELFLVEGLK